MAATSRCPGNEQATEPFQVHDTRCDWISRDRALTSGLSFDHLERTDISICCWSFVFSIWRIARCGVSLQTRTLTMK